jgi:hypothetical protein
MKKYYKSQVICKNNFRFCKKNLAYDSDILIDLDETIAFYVYPIGFSNNGIFITSDDYYNNFEKNESNL